MRVTTRTNNLLLPRAPTRVYLVSNREPLLAASLLAVRVCTDVYSLLSKIAKYKQNELF